MSAYPHRRPPPPARLPKPTVPEETSEQMHERWLREQEADEVAVTLGLAFQGERQGICYWRGNGAAFRAGYEAGKAAEREACALIVDAEKIGFACDDQQLQKIANAIRARGETNDQSSKG